MIKMTDRKGVLLTAERLAGCLQISLSDGVNDTVCFNATATHIGKLFECVVDEFFPKYEDDSES